MFTLCLCVFHPYRCVNFQFLNTFEFIKKIVYNLAKVYVVNCKPHRNSMRRDGRLHRKPSLQPVKHLNIS